MSRGFECDIKLEMFSVYPILSIELCAVTKFIVGPNHFTQNHMVYHMVCGEKIIPI